MPLIFVQILKMMWKQVWIENFTLSNIVPAVTLSSYLHLVQRLEYLDLPAQKFLLPHFLQL